MRTVIAAWHGIQQGKLEREKHLRGENIRRYWKVFAECQEIPLES
jgi:hypothetical protein